jgi:predicted RNase H-like HicB family nuclease
MLWRAWEAGRAQVDHAEPERDSLQIFNRWLLGPMGEHHPIERVWTKVMTAQGKTIDELRGKLSEHERLFAIALENDRTLQEILAGIGKLLPGVEATASGIVDAVANVVLKQRATTDWSNGPYANEERVKDLNVMTVQGRTIEELRAEVSRLASKLLDSEYLEYSLAVIANLRAALSRIVSAIPDQGPIPAVIDGPWTDSIVAAVAQLVDRPARSAQDMVAEAGVLRDQYASELDSLYAYTRDRLDPNRDRDPPSACACSLKYRELAPGVHAAYCPLAGKPT